MTTGTVSWATLGFSGTHWQKTARDEDIDLESGEYVPVGHIWKFDLEKSRKHSILEWNLIFQIKERVEFSVGVGLTHTENSMIKKLKEVRETSGLELEQEEPEPTIGRNFKTKFEIPNEYSENIMITDSDFILSNRTSAICITADMSFKSRLEADFKREYQNVEFLFRQRPGLGGMAALPPSVAQVPGKYLCFLVTRVNDRNTIDPEHVILALTRLRDFMIERGIVEVSMPVYDPNRGKLSSRELYAILHVVFAETEIMVHLHKKYYLSIAWVGYMEVSSRVWERSLELGTGVRRR